MVFSLFRSTIHTHGATQPVTFRRRGDNSGDAEGDNSGGAAPTLAQLVASAAPELAPGASFYVHPLLASGHAQTAYTALNTFESSHQVHYKRRIVTVEDRTYCAGGEQLRYDRWRGQSTFAVDYVVPRAAHDPHHMRFCPAPQAELPPRTEYLDPAAEHALLDNARPLVVALHGLSGGLHELYLRALLAQMCSHHGFDGLVLNLRGCAHHRLTLAQLFCGLWTNDLRYLLNVHLARWPAKRVYLVGFSLGGAIVANYLGQEGSAAPVRGAAVLGSPWDFSYLLHALAESPVGLRVYSPAMCQNLLRLMAAHNLGDAPAAPNTLRDFDDAFTSRLFGFNGALEYYRHASPDQRLLKVRVPTLILASQDDPIVGRSGLPYPEVARNPYIHMVVSSIGGHLGWFDYRHNRWYAAPVAKFFRELDRWDAADVPPDALPVSLDRVWNHDRLLA